MSEKEWVRKERIETGWIDSDNIVDSDDTSRR